MLPKTQEQKRIDALANRGGGEGGVGKYEDDKKKSEVFHIYGGGNESTGCEWTQVAGNSNKASGVKTSQISGNSNVVQGGDYSIVSGVSNVVNAPNGSVIVANGSKINGAVSSAVFGQSIETVGDKTSLITSIVSGTGTKLYGSVLDSMIIGNSLNLYRPIHCLATGMSSGTTGGAPYFDCHEYYRATFNSGPIELLDTGGNLKITGSFGSIGADYAEYFEWADGNPDNEDRRGRFVRLKGDKIELASRNDDYIIGVVSGNPSAVGNAAEMDWHGRYERDVFGALVTETDGNGEKRRIESKKYDDTVKYIPRSERAEWCTVGLVGQLVAVDDGTCKPDWYAAVSSDGTATNAVCRTAYRVMSRVDDTHVIIFVR